MLIATNPDFIAPRIGGAGDPTFPDTYPDGCTFVVVDVFTPNRSEHTSLSAAVDNAQNVRFPDDLVIIVYGPSNACLALLSAHGFDVNSHGSSDVTSRYPAPPQL